MPAQARKQKGFNVLNVLHVYWSFSSYIMAVKGLNVYAVMIGCDPPLFDAIVLPLLRDTCSGASSWSIRGILDKCTDTGDLFLLL